VKIGGRGGPRERDAGKVLVYTFFSGGLAKWEGNQSDWGSQLDIKDNNRPQHTFTVKESAVKREGMG